VIRLPAAAFVDAVLGILPPPEGLLELDHVDPGDNGAIFKLPRGHQQFVVRGLGRTKLSPRLFAFI